MASSSQIRQHLSTLTSKRAGLEKQLSEVQRKKATKEKEAEDRTRSAAKTKSESSKRMYLRQAEAARKAVVDHSRKVADFSTKIAAVSKSESTKSSELESALKRESADAARKAKDAQQRSDRQQRDDERRRMAERKTDQREARSMVSRSEERLTREIDALRSPRQERLRILYATASSDGGLRVDEEIRRVKAAIRMSTHRDHVEIEHLPAATAGDLLDGLTRNRPHVVHFSGHANENLLVFDDGSDDHGPGHAVDARAFKAAVEAPDEPPILVVLNACESAAHLDGLLGRVPLAVGMSDNIGDVDAITFATRFYSSLANGQSVAAALATAKAEMQMNGLPDYDLPTLAALDGIDASDVHLILVASD